MAQLQDWDAAVKDYTTILYYQPWLYTVRNMRARIYTARREWELAIEDYKEVQKTYPDDYTAWYGLQDINQPHEDLPMVDEGLVNDAM